ncbi:DUF1189 domain-containing protein [Candidatus Woesebacteria bacterium]|nr:DUF1189 domain-containing protein [Candidatus Woesebacteria bacterium]MCD8507396.1 DUF1189 domain-containing protein [Candidatus Woesebacteria bacterium]MCD8526989.1 DUF1189 domain-containing protein [Candidatus Woesebacteria bacterium]MCD8546770.1 DUF1189 domain-containing protein [Candidatus Woesebacteria bacterium]
MRRTDPEGINTLPIIYEVSLRYNTYMNQTRTKLLRATITDIPKIWWRTLTDVQIYRSLVHLPLSFGFLYSWLTYGVLAILATAVFFFRTIPATETRVMNTWNELITHWPSSLVVEYTAPTLNVSGLEEPFTVEYPSTFDAGDSFPPALATIRTEQAAEDIMWTELETAALFGIANNRFVMQPATVTEISETNSMLWSDLFGEENFTVTKSDVENATGSVQTAVQRTLWWLTLPFFVVSWLGLWIARLLILALYALFAQTLFWLFGTKIRYSASYRLGLYTLPIVELVFIAWKALYGTLLFPSSFWWIWLVSMALLAWFNRKGKLLQL